MSVRLRALAASGLAALAILAGGVSAATPAAASTQVCSSQDSGTLCLNKDTSGYWRITFYNPTMQAKDVRFGIWLASGQWQDNGSFWSMPGATNSFIFTGLAPGSWARPMLYDLALNKWFVGPYTYA
jgi:hypothetical protein